VVDAEILWEKEMTDLLAGICSGRLVELYQYWQRKHPTAELLPSRACIDPLDIPALLPWLILFELGQRPEDVRYRLIGTKVVERIGKDLTGRLVAEGYWGEQSREIVGRYWRVAQTRLPEFSLRRVRGADGNWHQYEFLLLPLASDGVKVDMLLAGVGFLDLL